MRRTGQDTATFMADVCVSFENEDGMWVDAVYHPEAPTHRAIHLDGPGRHCIALVCLISGNTRFTKSKLGILDLNERPKVPFPDLSIYSVIADQAYEAYVSWLVLKQ